MEYGSYSQYTQEPGASVDFASATYDSLRIGALVSSGATIAGCTIVDNTLTIATVAANLSGTVLTGAQPNITSLTGVTRINDTDIGSTFTEIGAHSNADANCFIDFHSSSLIVDHNARIIKATGANSDFDICLESLSFGALITGWSFTQPQP